MSNPVVVEVTRGGITESLHRGAYVVFDADGTCVTSGGDIARPIFPRSAVKAMQALPMVEGGAADRFGFGDRELALTCASHSGEERHKQLALSMLERAGLTEEALECGAHWPFELKVLIDFARSGKEPTSVCNNCSGKHAGFLCTAVHEGDGTRGYGGRDHPVQQRIREAMEAVTGASFGEAPCGTDGCSIPTYAVPLSALALGFARMATGQGLSPEKARAARRLVNACMAEPFYVAGTGRACTQIMQAAPGEIFAKTGAEGVFCGALPELGLGFALKIDDGTTRASEALCAGLLLSLLDEGHIATATLQGYADKVLKNWNKREVGAIRAVLPGS